MKQRPPYNGRCVNGAQPEHHQLGVRVPRRCDPTPATVRRDYLDDGWPACHPEPCIACGDLTWWRDHNGVPLCPECAL